MTQDEYERTEAGSFVLCSNTYSHEPHDVVPIIPGVMPGVRKVFRCVGVREEELIMAGSILRRVQRDAYFVSRTAGDARAAQRGRLGRRLVRRYATRELFRALGKMFK